MKKVTVEDLEEIHNQFSFFMKARQFSKARVYIKHLCLSDDKNILRTCMLLLKGVKDWDEFKDVYQELLVKLPNVI